MASSVATIQFSLMPARGAAGPARKLRAPAAPAAKPRSGSSFGRPRALGVRTRAKSKGWHETAREAIDEVMVENCIEAIADGDEGALRECLLEVQTEVQTEERLQAEQRRARAAQADPAKWHETAREAMDELVVENCFEAIVEGDEGALRECLIEVEAEAENEELNQAKQSPKDLHNYLESHKQDFKQTKKK